MEKLVKEYIEMLSNDDKPASEKFWELEERIKKDKKEIGHIKDDIEISGSSDRGQKIQCFV